MEPDSQLLSPYVVDTFIKATPEKRTGRKSMSRRSGQNGCIQEDGNWYVVRFWKDVAGQQKRQRVRERICPTSGAGKLSASERKRRAKEIIEASGADTLEYFEKVVRTNHGITFREQAEIWLEQMKNRKRKPVAPSTLTTWECCLENWLNPHIGHMPLDNIKNLALKNLGITMIGGGLGESAIRSYTNVVKMVVASAINEEGEELHPRKWNHSFIDLPRINNPKQPSFRGEVVTRIVAGARKEKYRLFFALSGGTGLRFGEALGIRVQDISPDCSTIKIVQKAWRSQIHNFLKTDSGSREIDLYPALASMLKEYLDKCKGTLTSDLLFQSKSGKPLHQSNVLRRTLHPILATLNELKCGCHAFRRFRITHLRKHGVPEDLIHFWLGHAGKSVTDHYSKLKDDLEFRREVASRVGLGFELPSGKAVVGLNGPKIETEALQEMAASI
ncbi:MAG: site-specific integrase [Candidatus Acidiferrales bacterium]